MNMLIQGIPTSAAEHLRNGGPDSHGQPPKVQIAEGSPGPCRHCLQRIKEGEGMMVFAYMPFPKKQPYAELGPIFLHQRACRHYSENTFPQWFKFLDPAILRGYNAQDWIVYETGTVVAGSDIEKTCEEIFQNSDVTYIHVRSKFNCFQCRVERA